MSRRGLATQRIPAFFGFPKGVSQNKKVIFLMAVSLRWDKGGKGLAIKKLFGT